MKRRHVMMWLFLFAVAPLLAAPVLKAIKAPAARTIIEDPKFTAIHEVPPIQPSAVEKRAEWIVENLVTPDGWSLTGYSSLKYDDELRASRWKIGFTGGEIAVDTLGAVAADGGTQGDPVIEQIRRDTLDDPIYRAQPVFGFHFSKEF